MNYLAHVFLARQSEQAMLGALLGDFVKGDIAGRYGEEIEAEILMHRAIDSYTDRHHVIGAARQRFDPATRRYAGILLDVFYDHLLARNWTSYSEVTIHDFTRRFYAVLKKHEAMLPDGLSRLAPRMIDQDWLASYQDFAAVEVAIGRISERLSRNGHLLRDGLQDLRANYSFLSTGFEMFFPELIQFVDERREKIPTVCRR